MSEQKHTELTIATAAHGGHFVMRQTAETRGYPNPVLFAGTLMQCLRWVEDNITK